MGLTGTEMLYVGRLRGFFSGFFSVMEFSLSLNPKEDLLRQYYMDAKTADVSSTCGYKIVSHGALMVWEFG